MTIPYEHVNETRPHYMEGLEDEAKAFQEAVRHPINSAPLQELIRPEDRVAVVIPDITRALPSDRLLPWLFEEFNEVPKENFTISLNRDPLVRNLAFLSTPRKKRDAALHTPLQMIRSLENF